ncbi:MAG: hypothetical protein NTV34_11970, partial [Proteobacteria bacterium]|nr:hypothetical protein [Pseudomonadota bacterium]
MSVLDFRLMIKNELAIRQERNPRYSLRAFSRDLSVSAPFLSQIINGARCPSERMANDIAQECKWSDSKTELFLRLVRFASCKDVSRKRQLAMDLSLDDQYQELQIGAFETVSNWIHFAILE